MDVRAVWALWEARSIPFIMATSKSLAAHANRSAFRARFAASRREIDRVGETYTVDTLRELRRFLPAHVELCFLMGADAAARLGEWREASELGSLARFAVASQRDDVALDGRDLSRLAQIIDARKILQVAMPQMDVSSTDLREKVRQGRSIRDEVPAVVADYIESHGLYQR